MEDDPKTYKEVIASNDSFFKDDIQDEMDLIISNNTWELVDLPKELRLIGC